MATSRRKTAAQLMRELKADPVWRGRQDAPAKDLAQREQVCAADEAELVAEVRALGYEIDSVYDLVNNVAHPYLERRFVGSYLSAYPTLLKHLQKDHHPRIREGVIRALTVKDGGDAVENCLLAEFHAEEDPYLKWVLANALRTAMPYHRRHKIPEIAEVFKGAGGLGDDA